MRTIRFCLSMGKSDFLVPDGFKKAVYFLKSIIFVVKTERFWNRGDTMIFLPFAGRCSESGYKSCR